MYTGRVRKLSSHELKLSSNRAGLPLAVMIAGSRMLTIPQPDRFASGSRNSTKLPRDISAFPAFPNSPFRSCALLTIFSSAVKAQNQGLNATDAPSRTIRELARQSGISIHERASIARAISSLSSLRVSLWRCFGSERIRWGQDAESLDRRPCPNRRVALPDFPRDV